MHRSVAVVALVSLLASAPHLGAAEPTHEGGVAHVAAQEAHPVVPPAGEWAGAMLIVVGALFLAAMVIGPMVRAEVPEEVPPAHSHDEPPGTSGHHGPGGTLNPDEPRDVRDLEHGHGGSGHH
jgi:hypothetical protein